MEQHIRNLLLIHDCVIIPNFGGFITNYRSAEINEEGHSFLPPRKQIGFNRQLTHNDGLLISHIADFKMISYEIAKHEVEVFAKELNSKIKNGEAVSINEIGNFSFDSQGNLQFEPNTSTIHLIDAFGLATFNFPEINKEDVLRRAEVKFKNREAVSKAINTKTFKRTLMATPLVLALAILSFKTNLIDNFNTSSLNPFQNIKKVEVTNSSNDNNVAVVETTIEKMTEKRNALLYEEAVEKTEPVQAVKVAEIVENKFFLIAGSFQTKENANSLITQLKSKGFAAEMLNDKKGRYRVAAKTFANENDAQIEMKRIRSGNLGFSVWMLRK